MSAGWPALRHPLFVRLWAGGVVSAVGTQMSNVAKIWMLYELTGSAAALGVEGLCFSIPMMVLPLLTGPLADRGDRAALLRWTMAAEAAMAAGLAVAAATGTLTPWLLFATAALEATRLAVDIPARGALIVTVVPPADLHSAQSLSSTVYSASALLGPAIGGLLLAAAGPAWVFAVNGVSCLIALAAFRGMPRGRGHRDQVRLGDGLRFAGRHRVLLRLQAVLLTTGALVIGVETLLPVLDAERWHGGSVGYGLLRAAPGLAAVAAGLVLARGSAPATPGRAIALCVAAAAATLAAVPFAPWLAVAFVLLTFGSIAVSAAQVHTLTRVQQITPDEVRGAVGGLTAMTMSGFAGVGAAAMALAAAGAGPAPIIATVAAATALTGLTVRAGRAADVPVSAQ
ncbi:MFS transporter [Dactylosporangium matsuzakiense]|uniref:MFS transporter n=1 Tax=Dactylosporangium matsuzakiense TaxID=53360 RepID=A0A9W6KFK1_9ACTN|nr:MFS transporter [Dactylosporangium matsuzakiense]GLK99330.1 MFS transporter [Dactylosporangium matsuzakiense]